MEWVFLLSNSIRALCVNQILERCPKIQVVIEGQLWASVFPTPGTIARCDSDGFNVLRSCISDVNLMDLLLGKLDVEVGDMSRVTFPASLYL